MKGQEALLKSYERQRKTFEEARSKRIANRTEQMKQIRTKIETLRSQYNELYQLNQNEKEFESFESFRTKSQLQSREQKNQKRPI